MWRRREEKGIVSEMTDHLGALLLLNLLWCLCSLPVVTAGAATAALERTVFDLLEEDRSRVAGKFLSYFKALFRPATVLWLFFLFAGADLAILGSMAGITGAETLLNSPVKSAAVVLINMVYCFVITWGFPLTAYQMGGSLFRTLGEGFSLAVSFPGKTFGCMGIGVFMVILSILCPLVFLGTAGCTAYLSCRILHPIIRGYLRGGPGISPEERE